MARDKKKIFYEYERLRDKYIMMVLEQTEGFDFEDWVNFYEQMQNNLTAVEVIRRKLLQLAETYSDFKRLSYYKSIFNEAQLCELVVKVPIDCIHNMLDQESPTRVKLAFLEKAEKVLSLEDIEELLDPLNTTIGLCFCGRPEDSDLYVKLKEIYERKKIK